MYENTDELVMNPGAITPKSITLRSPGIDSNYALSLHPNSLQSCVTPEKKSKLGNSFNICMVNNNFIEK